jgi:glycerophosphoryl diester phosphodiesterase
MLPRFFIFASLICLVSCNNSDKNQKMTNSTAVFDWQGHRGARGLMPENTIPAFLRALQYPVQTLELDVAVSKDSQIIVSHEPWMSAEFCMKPDGSPIQAEEAEKLLIYELTYEEIKKYDSGMRVHPRFPDQQKIPVWKPSLMDMVSNVEVFCEKNKRAKPRYNIEIKSQPSWDGIRTPRPEVFASMLWRELSLLQITDRVTIQSFDVRPLQILHRLDATIPIALLIENLDGVDKNIEKLGFTPAIYSPNYMLLNETVIADLKQKGIKIIPWTVNDPYAMKRLIELQVDGIITDYPNMIEDMQ